MVAAIQPTEGNGGDVKGSRYILAETRAEIAAALSNLQANERLLTASYKEEFEQQSVAHGTEPGEIGFRPSFLAPPHKPGKPPSQRAPSTLPPEANDDSRPSVAVDLRRQVEDFAWAGPADGTRRSRNDYRGYSAKKERGVAPKDIHGGRPFRVKVQPPVNPGAYQPCLVYDETRSFEAYLPCHEPSRRLTRMMQLIYESGVGAVVPHGGGKKNKGGKGYFDAVRVGPTLKIFTDTIVTEVDW